MDATILGKSEPPFYFPVSKISNFDLGGKTKQLFRNKHSAVHQWGMHFTWTVWTISSSSTLCYVIQI